LIERYPKPDMLNGVVVDPFDALDVAFRE